VVFAQNPEPFSARLGPYDRLDEVLELLPVSARNSPRCVFEAWVGDEVRSFDGERELAPEGRVAACHEQIAAIAGLEQSIAGNRSERVLRSMIQRGHFFVADDSAGLE